MNLEKRMVYVKGPTKEELFSAFSSGESLVFFGKITDSEIRAKVRNIVQEDGSGQSFNLEVLVASDRKVSGYYNTHKRAGWFEYLQDN